MVSPDRNSIITEKSSRLAVQQVEPPINVLIVEDNPGDVMILRELMRASAISFTLFSASALSEAVEMLGSGNFDIILLDLGLPDSTGIITLKQLLSYEFCAPVIVMTGLDDEDTALESLREGAQDYLVKNRLEPENIARSIRYSIERKKVENLRKRNNLRLTILSETTTALHEGDDFESIYTLINKSIRELVKDTYSLTIELTQDDPELIRISNSDQFTDFVKKFSDVLKLDLDKPVLPLNKNQIRIIEKCNDGRVHRIEKGIFELLGEELNEEICREYEKKIGIRHTFIVGFLKNEILFGGIVIFTANEMEEDDITIIENLCSQASLSIYRRTIKKNLVLSEARYQKLAEELEQKVHDRTRELEVANQQLRLSETRLRELNATKDKFFNIVAHDLKNPFTSLLGATEVLTQNIENMEKEKIRKLAQILNDSSKSGYAILLNLLDWSRSQTGQIKINPQNLNLTKILEDNVTDIHLSSRDKEIVVTTDMPDECLITVDKNMINTILRNLLSNAIKFTPRGGKVHIRCKPGSESLTVSIKDNGIGIPAENIGTLFRIDSKYSRPGTEKEVGTGLGLKLCREFVEKLGGKIWVESLENSGSEFFFTLPF
ncbi:MAG: ATP-binding protein [Candidatus Aminicenantes bacterium]